MRNLSIFLRGINRFTRRHNKYVNLFLLLIIVAVVPLTVFMSQQSQDNRQHAEDCHQECDQHEVCDTKRQCDTEHQCDHDPDTGEEINCQDVEVNCQDVKDNCRDEEDPDSCHQVCPDPTDPPDEQPTDPPQPTDDPGGGGGCSAGQTEECSTSCDNGVNGTCGGHKYCEEGGGYSSCQCETREDTCKDPGNGGGGGGGGGGGCSAGDTRTCNISCGNGGTCGGHQYCREDSGEFSDCQCEAQKDSCDKTSAPPNNTCTNGDTRYGDCTGHTNECGNAGDSGPQDVEKCENGNWTYAHTECTNACHGSQAGPPNGGGPGGGGPTPTLAPVVPIQGSCSPQGAYNKRCTGNRAGCADNAGEAFISVCLPDSSGRLRWNDGGDPPRSECRTECGGSSGKPARGEFTDGATPIPPAPAGVTPGVGTPLPTKSGAPNACGVFSCDPNQTCVGGACITQKATDVKGYCLDGKLHLPDGSTTDDPSCKTNLACTYTDSNAGNKVCYVGSCTNANNCGYNQGCTGPASGTQTTTCPDTVTAKYDSTKASPAMVNICSSAIVYKSHQAGCDANGDGKFDDADLKIIVADAQKNQPTPPPAPPIGQQPGGTGSTNPGNPPPAGSSVGSECTQNTAGNIDTTINGEKCKQPWTCPNGFYIFGRTTCTSTVAGSECTQNTAGNIDSTINGQKCKQPWTCPNGFYIFGDIACTAPAPPPVGSACTPGTNNYGSCTQDLSCSSTGDIIRGPIICPPEPAPVLTGCESKPDFETTNTCPGSFPYATPLHRVIHKCVGGEYVPYDITSCPQPPAEPTACIQSTETHWSGLSYICTKWQTCVSGCGKSTKCTCSDTADGD